MTTTAIGKRSRFGPESAFIPKNKFEKVEHFCFKTVEKCNAHITDKGNIKKILTLGIFNKNPT